MKKREILFILLVIIIIVIIITIILINIFTKNDKISDKTPQEIFISDATELQAVIQYPEYNELFFSEGKGYEFKNYISNKLIIHLEGTSWDSAIGISMEGNHMADFLLSIRDIKQRYNFFFPEKFDREIGKNYRNDLAERQRYSFDNLLDNYYSVISEYLSNINYESIIIMGSSEGAYFLPILYDRLKNPNIRALISISGAGGLTDYDQHKLIFDKLLANDRIFESLTEDEREEDIKYIETILSIYQTEPYPDSPEFINDHPNSLTYRYLSSFMRLKLFDYYKNINIPILFIHGEFDTTIPVETIKYIETNLPDKPFDYIFYQNMAHGIRTRGQYIRLQGDITTWILGIDQSTTQP